MTLSLRSWLLVATVFLLLFQLSSANLTGNTQDCVWSASIRKNASGGYDGSATITGYTGPGGAVAIPPTVIASTVIEGVSVTMECPVTAIEAPSQLGVFRDQTRIETVSIPSTVSSIGELTFYNCSSLKELTIPSGVTAIQHGTFLGCRSLLSITIPSGVTYIGRSAFSDCTGLKSLNILSELVYIGSSAFSGCTGLTSVTIPDSVTTILDSAFANCSGLVNFTIPDGVTTIADGTFSGCHGLTSIAIHSGVTTIGNFAFASCIGLNSVDIPSSVTNIGNHAFNGCSELNYIVIPDGVTSIRPGVFSNCTQLKDIVIPETVTSIGLGAFYNCGSLLELTIPSGVTNIEDWTFFGCKGLMSVTITSPSGLIGIGDSAFRGCTGLTSVNIPDSVTSIGNSAFQDCTSLPNVTIPTGVTTIGEATFAFCRALTNITIPSSVTSIGVSAFVGCSGMISVTIPASVTSIGTSAFGIRNLNAAFFLGNAPAMGVFVFESPSSTVVYYLSENQNSGFTSPTWKGHPCFIAAPYGGVIPNIAINEAHLIGGAPADGDVRLEAPVTQAPLLWQRQTTPATLDMESSRTLRLGSPGTVRVEAGYGALTIGKDPGDGFLTAGGAADTPGTLVFDHNSANDLTINAVIANNGNAVVGLTKNGSGRAILNASNSYSGETSITGGTLVLKSACLADTAAVRVASNGTLNLDYSGTDVVGALYIGGTPQPNGVYDSTNINGLITGPGKLQIGPFASYSVWTDVNAPGQSTSLDHDHDGVPNGIEYFMGKSGSDYTANPGIAPNGTVTWPKSPAFNGNYAVQTSENLKDWIEVTEDPAQVTRNPDSVIWTRPDGPERQFVRLLVNPD